MARKFDADFNDEIYRTIKSFNQKVLRAERRGQKNLPELRSVREFKAQFKTKEDAKRELKQYRALLNNKEALQKRQTMEGTITNWEFDYIVNNLRATNKWIDREINKARIRYQDYPTHLYAIREDVNVLMHEKYIINRELNKLTARELKVVAGTIDKYKRRNVKISAGREYFMKNLDSLLTAKGVMKESRAKIYKKLDRLSNDQFFEFYKRHDIVSDVMIMIPSDPLNEDNIDRKKKAKEAVSDDITNQQLDDFMENVDSYVEEAKSAIETHTGESIGTGKNKISYEEFLKLFD